MFGRKSIEAWLLKAVQPLPLTGETPAPNAASTAPQPVEPQLTRQQMLSFRHPHTSQPQSENTTPPPLPEPTPPFLWPDTRTLAGTHFYDTQPVFQSAVASASALFGTVHNLTHKGLAWLHRQLSQNQQLSVSLLVAIYPACRTTSDVLGTLLADQGKFHDRLSARLLLVDRDEDRVTTNLCIVASTGASQMLVSPSGDFAIEPSANGFLSLCFPSETSLHHQFLSWFGYHWTTGKPLDLASVQMPDLVPAEGDPDASARWQLYLNSLDQRLEGTPNVTVDPETGEVTDVDGNPVDSPLDKAKVPRPSVAMVKVGKVLHCGQLATIDNASRVGPLDCPISAETFGIETDRRTGAVSRKVQFRVSAIDDKTLKKLDSYRKRTRELLNKMSYPLANGARWVPGQARPLLESELERVDAEAQELLGATVSDDIAGFVELRRESLARDAQSQYEELHGGGKMPADALDKIVTQLVARLTKATGGKLLPKLSFLDVRISTAPDSDWSTQASQALHFLASVARYPRECLTDPFFRRGLRIEQKDLIQAMDVIGDALVAGVIEHGGGVDLAHQQLGWIEKIEQFDAEDVDKCDALYSLMQGHDEERIRETLTRSHQKNRPSE